TAAIRSTDRSTAAGAPSIAPTGMALSIAPTGTAPSIAPTGTAGGPVTAGGRPAGAIPATSEAGVPGPAPRGVPAPRALGLSGLLRHVGLDRARPLRRRIRRLLPVVSRMAAARHDRGAEHRGSPRRGDGTDTPAFIEGAWVVGSVRPEPRPSVIDKSQGGG